MLKNKNVSLEISYKCIGCGLCEAICPKRCITIKEKDNIGLLPIIDESKCINCGLCVKTCPTDSLNNKEKIEYAINVYKGKSKEKEIIINSSSGGIVSSILIDLFDKKEIDAAIVANFDEELNIYGDIITSREAVLNHSGSFYHISKMLINVNNIKNYNSVVFVGLPCQNVALRKFIENYKINNIYATISLVCTIGRMKNGMIEYLKEEGHVFEKIDKVYKYKSRYGEKRPGKIIMVTKNKEINFECIHYFSNKDYFYTPNGCLNCNKLFGVEFSDISVGDNWGIKTDEKVAIFTANSEKGLRIIQNNSMIDYSISDVDELIKSQPLGYPLKYHNREKINKKIIKLKTLYRKMPKNKITKKLLMKYRGLILQQLQRG